VIILGDVDAVAIAAAMATAGDEAPDFLKAILTANAAVLHVGLKVCAETVATGLAGSADIAAGPTIRRVREIFALTIAAQISFRAGMVTGATVMGIAIKENAHAGVVEATTESRVTYISADSTKWHA
jgi:hypothetical protein